jgi:hypothetical protein
VRSIISMRTQGAILGDACTTESNTYLIGDRFRIKAAVAVFLGLTSDVDLASDNSGVVGKLGSYPKSR